MASAHGPVVPVTRPTFPATSSRRKPQFTYRSPSAADGDYNKLPIIHPSPYNPYSAPTIASSASSTSGSSSSSTRQARSSRVLLDPSIFPPTSSPAPTRKKYDMGPPLPLYHPFGKLAMSLAPLDTEHLGLPPLIIPEEPARKNVGRARKQTDSSELAVMAEVATAAAAQESKAKEKAVANSPRKRASGGRGGGAGGKRKRKDADDTDPTYPAKRTRLPRGAAAKESPALDALADSPPDDSERVSATPDDSAVEERKTSNGRGRKRRGRGGATTRRRNSSASEATEASATPRANGANGVNGVDDAPTPSVVDGEADIPNGDAPHDEERAADANTNNTRKLSEPL